MDKKSKINLTEVIGKVRLVADQEYEGDLVNNELAVFSHLSIVEKEILLRGFFNLWHMVQDEAIKSACMATMLSGEDTKVKAPVKTEKIATELDSMGMGNKHELLALKTWLFKWMLVMLSMILVGFTVFMVATGKSTSGIGALFKGVVDVGKLLLGG